jgi:hypothetical protein
MLDIHPLAALNGIHIIKGKPTQSAELMRSLVQRAGHKFRTTTMTTERSVVSIERADDPGFPVEVTFTMQDARDAGLTGSDTWKHYPSSMLHARATSMVVRAACPDVLMGISYTAEELGAAVDADGNVLDVAEAARIPLTDAHQALVDRFDLLPAELADKMIAYLRKAGGDDRLEIADFGEAWFPKIEGLLDKAEAIELPIDVEPVDMTVAQMEMAGYANPDHDPNITDAEIVEDDEPAEESAPVPPPTPPRASTAGSQTRGAPDGPPTQPPSGASRATTNRSQLANVHGDNLEVAARIEVLDDANYRRVAEFMDGRKMMLGKPIPASKVKLLSAFLDGIAPAPSDPNEPANPQSLDALVTTVAALPDEQQTWFMEKMDEAGIEILGDTVTAAQLDSALELLRDQGVEL